VTPVALDIAFRVAAAFGAGLASVASPCVLPVVPIVVTGTDGDHRLRPLLVVLGLSSAFVAMGIVGASFGSLFAGGTTYTLEKVAGAVILAFGVLTLLDRNVFKGLWFLQGIRAGTQGPWSGLVLGLTLGVVWIPCVGPFLASVLTLVATEGELLGGVGYLAAYSLGFAVPMLLAGYASRFFRERLRRVQRGGRRAPQTKGPTPRFPGSPAPLPATLRHPRPACAAHLRSPFDLRPHTGAGPRGAPRGPSRRPPSSASRVGLPSYTNRLHSNQPEPTDAQVARQPSPGPAQLGRPLTAELGRVRRWHPGR
jgi:cytochrome c-type biogenesis protein